MEEQYKPIIEALLFIATEPLVPGEIERVLGISAETVLDVIEGLRREYDESGRGFQVRRVGKGYSIVTRPEYAEYIRELFQPKVQQRLTQAALETLAIIAYKQPITRGEIEDIRGVKVEKALITLQKRNLIHEMGRKHTIGTPIIYGTTGEFLAYFGLGDLSELPEPSEFALLEQNAAIPDGVEDEELYEGMEAEFETAMRELHEDLQNVNLRPDSAGITPEPVPPAEPSADSQPAGYLRPDGSGAEAGESPEPALAGSKRPKGRKKRETHQETASDLYQLIPLLKMPED